MAAPDRSLIQEEIARQGWKKKSASSKHGDRVRENWKDRWFVLKKHMLFYYKKDEDRTPKGEIDLRSAKIELADEKTGKPFSIKIGQAKQIFTYFQCENQADQMSWYLALKRAAGDDDMAEFQSRQPAERSGALCSFGVVTFIEDGQPPERVVVLCTLEHTIQLLRDDQIFKTYAAKNLLTVRAATTSDLRLAHTDGITNLFSVTCEFKDVKEREIINETKKFFCGSLAEAEQLEKVLSQCATGDFSHVRNVTKSQIKANATIQLGDNTPGCKMLSRWAAVGDKRLLIFRRQETNFPAWVISIPHAKIESKLRTQILIKTGIESCLVEFENTEVRKLWLEIFETIAKENPQQQEDEKKAFRITRDDLPAAEEKGPTGPADFSLHGIAQGFTEEEESYVCTWGLNDIGQLGNAESANLTVPGVVPILATKKPRYISAGDTHGACATAQGHVYTWGAGPEGQLGLGPLLKSPRPSLLTSLVREKIMVVECGRAHTLAVNHLGKIFSWGSNTFGQLGNPDVKNSPYPAMIPQFKNKQVRFIATGGDHSGALCYTTLGNHEVWMWGANNHGQIGIAQNSAAVFVPKMLNTLSISEDKVVQIACADGVSGAVTEKGKLYTWGNSDHGQLGHGSTRPRNMPSEVEWFTEHDMTVRQISLGSHHAIALGLLRNQPVVVTWGAAVTNGFQEDQVLPAAVSALERVGYIAASNTHSISINSELKLFSFGLNKFGELGNGKVNVQALVRVRFAKECRIVQAKCGNCFTVALLKGDKPETVTTSHYAAKPTKEKEDIPMASSGPLPGMPAPMFAAPVDEKGAEAKIAELLNMFHIKPSDPKAATFEPPPPYPDDDVPPPPYPEDDLPPPPSENIDNRPPSHSSISRVQNVLSAKLAQNPSLFAPKPTPAPVPVFIQPEPVTRAAAPSIQVRPAAPSVAPTPIIIPAPVAAQPVAAFQIGGGFSDPDLPAAPEDMGAEPMQDLGSVPEPQIASPVDHDGHDGGHDGGHDDGGDGHDDDGHDDPSKAKKKKKKELPPGWKKVKDPRTGRHYYYNTQTRETTWKRPKMP